MGGEVKFQFLFALLAGFVLRVGAGEPAKAIATITAGFVTGISVTSGGSGYVLEPLITISGGGGVGATAKAILLGDKVSQIIVLTAGAGYATAPAVTIEAPPNISELKVALVPAVTLSGRAGSTNRVEWSDAPSGPWNLWTNVVLGTNGIVLVDLSTAGATRYYRSLSTPVPPSPSLRDRLVWIAPGSFFMGSPETQVWHQNVEVYHSVTISKGFWMSDHETTQSEYQSVMGVNPSHFLGADLPVESVSWNDATAFCRQLTLMERAAGNITTLQEYRLPTEAEWEFACRAGTTDPTYGPLDAVGWWTVNSSLTTHPVRSKQPNASGLYDMLGNVREWCSDWYGFFTTDAVTDPTGPSAGDWRSVRGGFWGSFEVNCRAPARSIGVQDSSDNGTGFRPVLTAGD